jgi:putative membrane protein
MLQPSITKNDSLANKLIWSVSIIVFLAVVGMSKINLSTIVTLPFNPHIFATINAIINSMVAVLLVAGIITAKSKNYAVHKKIMLTAIALSVIFLLSYICHHLFAGETKYGDIDHNGALSLNEKMAAGSSRIFYYLILLTHIPLAAIILPFILFTAYRALSGEYEKHKKLVRITWPVWFFVAVSGVVVFAMISPYYN